MSPPSRTTPLPVVLHHGLFGYDQLSLGPMQKRYWRGIDAAIAADGHPVVITRATPTGSIARRAKDLRACILAKLAAAGLASERFILVGHSMGGLDARHMVAHLDMADRVAAVVTVATPHRGSPAADWTTHHLGRRLGLFRWLRQLGLDIDAFDDLTTARCAEFNAATPDHPDVPYYSVGGSAPLRKMPPWAVHTHRIIHVQEGDNDGLVSLQSARWGRWLGTWEADHWQTINRGAPAPIGRPMDISPAYLAAVRSVVADLAHRGLIEPAQSA